MKFMIMITLLLQISLAFALSSNQQVQLIEKKDIPFSEIGKSSSYKGVFVLEDTTLYEVYQPQFPNTLKVNQALCLEILNVLFGEHNFNVQLRAGHTGTICTFDYHDKIRKQTPAYSIGIIGFIRAKPVVIEIGRAHV